MFNNISVKPPMGHPVYWSFFTSFALP